MDDRLKIVFAGVVGAAAGVVGNVPLVVWGLLGLQACDLVSGVLAAAVSGQADSATGWRGLQKKALTWVLIGAVFVAQTALGGIAPIAEVLAGFYGGIELLSIVENAAKAGVPVPAFVRDALAQIQRQTGTSLPRAVKE